MNFLKRLPTVLLATLLVAAPSAARPVQTAPPADQPAVVLAVAPNYPAVARAKRAEGDVVVEVKIDAKGKVVSAVAVSGHELLRRSSETAAAGWQFAAQEGAGQRAARLTFNYSTVYEREGASGEHVVTFLPPYKVAVKFHPPILH